jgi:hypothetical protein
VNVYAVWQHEEDRGASLVRLFETKADAERWTADHPGFTWEIREERVEPSYPDYDPPTNPSAWNYHG